MRQHDTEPVILIDLPGLALWLDHDTHGPVYVIDAAPDRLTPQRDLEKVFRAIPTGARWIAPQYSEG